MQKKLAFKLLKIFIAIMIFFTFTSRTINYLLTPKVIVSSLKKDNFAVKKEVQEFTVSFEYDEVFGEKPVIKFPIAEDLLEVAAEGVNCTIEEYMNKTKGEISNIQVEDNIKYGYITVKSPYMLDWRDENKILITLINKSAEKRILVPNASFIDEDVVLVMKSRNGFWGEENYVKRCKVSKGKSDGIVTEVLSGISENDMVVIGWDRPIDDGDTVTVPLE